jgi:cell division protein FtsL
MNNQDTNYNKNIENIKKWVSFDNEIKLLNDKINSLREKKNELKNNILNYVEHNNFNKVVSITGGKLSFIHSKHYKPLTLSYINECLSKSIYDKEQIERIMKIIKENRLINQYPDIKRYYNEK